MAVNTLSKKTVEIKNCLSCVEKKKKLTQARVKELLNYNPKSGVWTWKVNKSVRAKKGDIAGHVNSRDGYRRINVDQNMLKSSRLAWFYMEGYWPEQDVDHIDRDRTNDRWSNLRHVSRQCNIRNSNTQSNNKTGVVGVFWDRHRKKFMAYIAVNNKRVYLGRFTNIIKAVKARWEAEKKYSFPNCISSSTAYRYLKEKELI